MPTPRLLPGLSPQLRRLVLALCTMEFLEWMGGGAIVPLLPTYLRQHGSGPALVGIVMAAYFAAGTLTQFPLGRLVDKVGPRPVILGGLVLFAGGCVGFALVPGALSGIGFRALQGTGAGSVTVASAGTIASILPPEQRGSAFGALYGSEMFALAVGPLAGGLIGAASMRWLFIGAALAAGASALPALGFLPPGRIAARDPLAPTARPARPRAVSSFGVAGAAVVFVAVGLLSGMYESCWSLLLHLRGATSIEIGLSWTLYCLPFALLSLPSGRLADRADRRVLAVAGICVSAAFSFVYPQLHAVAILVTLGCLEAVGAVLVTPAASSVLASVVRADEQGRAQGLVGSARTGATALSAAACGALFAVTPYLPFVVVGATLALLAGATFLCWRSLPGRGAEPSVGVVGYGVARQPGAPEQLG